MKKIFDSIIQKSIFLYIFLIFIYTSFFILQINNYNHIKKHEILHAKTLTVIIEKYLYSAFYSSEVIEDFFYDYNIEKFNSLNPDKNSSYYILDNDFNIIQHSKNVQIFPFTYEELELLTHQISDNFEVLSVNSKYNDLQESWLIKKTDSQLMLLKTDSALLESTLMPLFFKEIFKDIDKILKDLFQYEKPLIKFVAIQDTMGIIAGTEGLESLERILSSEFLTMCLNNDVVAHRFINIDDSQYIEIVSPVFFQKDYTALIRFCIGTKNIQQTFYQTLLYIFFYTIVFSLLFIFIFLISSHNKKMLKLRQELDKAKHFASIGQLGAELAHEIKNPLNTISMIMQRIKQSGLCDEQNNEYINITYNEVIRLNDIINSFLNYSKNINLKTSKIKIKAFIDSLINLFLVKASNEQVSIKNISEIDFFIIADEDLFKQCIINILLNSLEALNQSEKTQKFIKISYKTYDKSLILTIEDNANGISQENLPKIFDLFFSKKNNGSGIGLANAKKIIDLHQGELLCHSEVGKGTVMTIKLPM